MHARASLLHEHSFYFLIFVKACCSVAESYQTLCDPVGCSTPGFPALHYLPEFAQTHARWDAVSRFSPVWLSETQWTVAHQSPLPMEFSRQEHGSALKNLPAMRETQIWSLDQEDTLERGMATHSSILAWRISWTEEPADCSPQDGKESDMTERLTLFTFMSIESTMLPNHLILCCPLLLLPSIFPRKERFIFFLISNYTLLIKN